MRFRPTTIVHIERPVGTGEAVELLQYDANPYSATIGLRVPEQEEALGLDTTIHGEAAYQL